MSKTLEVDFALTADEAEVLAQCASVLAAQMPDGSMRSRVERLALAAADGAIPGDLLPTLEAALGLALDRHPTLNRAVIQSIFARTPRGRELHVIAREITRALRTLRGQTIADMRFSTTGPSDHSLVIETDRVRVSLDIGRGGATISNLELG